MRPSAGGEPARALERHGRSLADDDVGAALEALDELGDVLRLVGEVALQSNIASRRGYRVCVDDGPAERVQRARVADVTVAAQDAQRQHVAVRLQRLGGGVGAAVVEYEDLVLAREVLEDFANTPEQHADGRRFVVRGNADIQHVVCSEGRRKLAVRT